MKKLICRLFNLENSCNHEFLTDNQLKIVRCRHCKKRYWYDLPEFKDQGITMKS